MNELTKGLLPDQGYYQTSKLSLQPLTSIFFNPMKDGWSQRGSIEVTNVLLILGILILLIASLNYINLSTACSMKRITEIGVRKVHGARKYQLIGQFPGESIFFSMVSMIIAVLLLLLFIQAINRFSNILFTIHPDSDLFSNGAFLGIALGTALATGIFSLADDPKAGGRFLNRPIPEAVITAFFKKSLRLIDFALFIMTR